MPDDPLSPGHEAERHEFAPELGITLVGDVSGPVDAPLVVLMHGGGQTRHSWSRAAQHLAAQGYRVINYDARGHGESDWSAQGAYDLGDRVTDLRAVLGDIAPPYALVGASLGGATAIYAVAQGLKPSALVLVDIVPEPEADGIGRIVAFMRSGTDGYETLDAAADAVAAYNPARERPADPSGLMRNLRAGDDGRLHWHWDPKIVSVNSDIHLAQVQEASHILAAQEDIAVLLVRGLLSEVVSNQSVNAFRALMPRLEVVDVGGAGHMVAGDRNDAFNEGVIAFLLRHMPPDGTGTDGIGDDAQQVRCGKP